MRLRSLSIALGLALAAAATRADEQPPATAALEDAPLVSVEAGAQIGQRKVTWRDRVTPSLAGYQSGVLGLGVASIEAFPARGKGLPIVSQLGLVGSVARSLRAHDAGPAGSPGLDSLWHAWDVGGRYRGTVGGIEYYSISLRYGSSRWDFTGPPQTGALLPGGFLQWWRPGLDLRLPLGPVALTLSGGYRFVVVRDAIGRAFPRADLGGLDGAVAVSLDLPQRLRLKLGGRYVRFFSSLHPMPGDKYVAGGALDEYAVLDLTLAWRV
jgi:hypothetical protein